MTRYPLTALERVLEQRGDAARRTVGQRVRERAAAVGARRAAEERLATADSASRVAPRAPGDAAELAAAAAHARRAGEVRTAAAAALRQAEDRLAACTRALAEAACASGAVQRDRCAIEAHHRAWSTSRLRRAAAAADEQLDAVVTARLAGGRRHGQ